LLWSLGLRLAAIAIGAPEGVVTVFVAIVVAQVVATASISLVAVLGYRRYPRQAPRPLGADRPAVRAFAIQSTIATRLASMRTSLPTVLVGMVARPNQVAYFRAAQAPQTAFLSLSGPARLVLLAEQTRDVEHGRPERAHALLRRYIRWAAGISLVVTPPAWIFMPTLVRIVYHAK